MGEFKEINDKIYEQLIDRLSEEGYDNISSKDNNEIVDLIDSCKTIEELVIEAINILK